MNTYVLLLGALAYLALGTAFLAATRCTPGNLRAELGQDADDLGSHRHLPVVLAVLWGALLFLWPLVAAYETAYHAHHRAHYLGHRLLYHPSLDCTDEDGWYGSDVCRRRPLAWVVRR
ncbi:hypothetical protein C1I97_29085 [Streptomyces sp. NTH33]|uniref:hypothetical protein n=1 Tax=Streptomyces sp. NTH33 TaxID=1735453 RepID=UPI000DA74DE9|nr:hypothetical protein [Streptomyces sp. NTH33]PZG92831.1 hypothetical protein C1I97_29085 [Streptomyces sp. NTH33]